MASLKESLLLVALEKGYIIDSYADDPAPDIFVTIKAQGKIIKLKKMTTKEASTHEMQQDRLKQATEKEQRRSRSPQFYGA